MKRTKEESELRAIEYKKEYYLKNKEKLLANMKAKRDAIKLKEGKVVKSPQSSLSISERERFLAEIRIVNAQKFAEIVSDPDWVEKLAKKYLGEKWQIAFAAENHPFNRSSYDFNDEFREKQNAYTKKYYWENREKCLAQMKARKHKLS